MHSYLARPSSFCVATGRCTGPARRPQSSTSLATQTHALPSYPRQSLCRMTDIRRRCPLAVSCCSRGNDISGNISGAADDSTGPWASDDRDGSHTEGLRSQSPGGEGVTEGGRVPARDDAQTLGQGAPGLQPAGGGDDGASRSSSSGAASATGPGTTDSRQQQAIKAMLQEALKPLLVEVQEKVVSALVQRQEAQQKSLYVQLEHLLDYKIEKHLTQQQKQEQQQQQQQQQHEGVRRYVEEQEHIKERLEQVEQLLLRVVLHHLPAGAAAGAAGLADAAFGVPGRPGLGPAADQQVPAASSWGLGDTGGAQQHQQPSGLQGGVGAEEGPTSSAPRQHEAAWGAAGKDFAEESDGTSLQQQLQQQEEEKEWGKVELGQGAEEEEEEEEEEETEGERGVVLMDYVQVISSDNPHMPPGTMGVVLGSDRTAGGRLQVLSLSSPARGSFHPSALAKVTEGGVEGGASRWQYLPYDASRLGVPVTRHTAATGMLVRRLYDRYRTGSSAAWSGKVGVIVQVTGPGDTCLVEWEGGARRKYNTGAKVKGKGKVKVKGKVKRKGSFQLVHLELSPTSGAPVVVGSTWSTAGGVEGPGPGAYGTAVERGTHWTYGGAEPGVGSMVEVAETELQGGIWECTAKVQWPNGQILSHRASSASGFDLCHSAVRGDPVTLFTARQGLRVEVQAGSSRWYGGVLSRPLKMCDNGNVQWEVFKEGNGKAVKVEVGVAPCNPLMRFV